MHDRGEALLRINIEKIEPAEYKEANRAIGRKFNPMSFGGYAVALFTTCLIAVWLANRDFIAVIVLATYTIAMAIYFRWLRLRQLREARERADKDLPVQLTFTENGVLGETKFSETFRRLDGYQGYLETKSTFILLPTYRSFSVIPKRVIDSASQSSLQEVLARLKRL